MNLSVSPGLLTALIGRLKLCIMKEVKGRRGNKEREDTCARAVLRPLQQPLALQQMPGTYYGEAFIYTQNYLVVFFDLERAYDTT